MRPGVVEVCFALLVLALGSRRGQLGHEPSDLPPDVRCCVRRAAAQWMRQTSCARPVDGGGGWDVALSDVASARANGWSVTLTTVSSPRRRERRHEMKYGVPVANLSSR